MRKGCKWCDGPLVSFKEKVLKTCDACARDTLNSAGKILDGNIKEGTDELKLKILGAGAINDPILDSNIRAAMSNNEKKILKRAKKMGLTEEETKQALEIFRSQ